MTRTRTRWGFRKLKIAMAGMAWVVGVSLGGMTLLRYENTPSPQSAVSSAWPSGSPIKPQKGSPRLLVFVHPKCPCSRATIAELGAIMARCQGKMRATVLFFAPLSQGPHWAKTDLWQEASAIPGVTAIEDGDGQESRRFGALTSGQALLYDARGALVFQGGITGSRGHEGPNRGADAIVSFVITGSGGQSRTRVFGCSLRGNAL